MIRTIFTLFLCSFLQSVYAQIRCKVLEQDTHEPVIGAVITVEGTKKIISITDEYGYFRLSEDFDKSVIISYIGFISITIRPQKDGVYYLNAATNELQEVVITAREGHGLSSTSIINKQAMEHLQPSSFADLLELLPGGRANDPQLNVPNIIGLREAGIESSQYSTSSLGTRFVIDGAPISTNGNMQYISGALDRTSSKRDFANKGLDMRTLTTDDIQEVTIIRGIPSVQYGALTSGLIKVKRHKGGNDLSARFKADMDTKLFYVAKAFEWEKRGLSLNVSADLLNNKAEPRNLLETYKRLSFSARLNKHWHTEAMEYEAMLNLDYGGSFDDDKVDPEFNHDGIDKYKSIYNRYATNLVVDMHSNREHSIFKKSELSLSFSYEKNLLERTRLVQLDGDTPAAMTMTSGESDAVFITPSTYTATHTVDGRPISLYLKGNAAFSFPVAGIANSFLLGADYQMDRNIGDGQLYDRLHPVYTETSYRPRKYSSIPASQILSAYAEERISMGVGNHKLDVEAGVRAERMLGINKLFAIHGKMNIDPRVNVGWTFPAVNIGNDKMTVNITGGIGWHSMFPTIDLLYPEPVYMDIVELNYYHSNPDFRRMYLQTYVIDPTNTDLNAARNLKWEVKGDIDWSGNRLTVTYFVEDMKSGFRSMSVYAPYKYKEYDASGVDADALTARPNIAALPYSFRNVLRAYEHTTNGSRTYKRGLEWVFSTKRFNVVNTRVTVSGAWFKTEYHNSLPIMYKPTRTIGGQTLELVGIYRDDEGYIRESTNTNFTFDTTIPKLKLGFSLSFQCVWLICSENMSKENVPLKYMDSSGNIHPYTETDSKDVYLQHLMRNYTDGMFNRQTIPFCMDMNFKATKKMLNDKFMVALFVNKLWDMYPDYKRNDFIIRRYVTPYFGIEMNMRL